jgi:hypothetical protein
LAWVSARISHTLSVRVGATMDIVERLFVVTAATSFFVLIGLGILSF